MLLDVGAEKATDPPPGCAAKHHARQRQQPARVETPCHPPCRVWRHEEIKARDGPTGSKDSCDLPQCGRRVRDVAKHVGEAQGVERGIGKRQGFDPAGLKLDARAQSSLGNSLGSTLEHRLADVDADDMSIRGTREHDRHPCGAGGHVEDALRVGCGQPPDQLAAPAAVLAERKQLGQAVITAR